MIWKLVIKDLIMFTVQGERGSSETVKAVDYKVKIPTLMHELFISFSIIDNKVKLSSVNFHFLSNFSSTFIF